MAGVSAFGSTFTWNSVAMGNIISISLDGAKLTAIDTTTIAERHRTFVTGIIDSGTLSIECNYDTGGGQSGFWDQISTTASSTAPVAKTFSITAGSANNPGYTISGSGILTDFSTKIGIDSALTVSVSIQITGALTITDTA
jgi:hypothetical protein